MRYDFKIVVLLISLLVVCFAEDELKRIHSGFAAQVNNEKITYVLPDYELPDITINAPNKLNPKIKIPKNMVLVFSPCILYTNPSPRDS